MIVDENLGSSNNIKDYINNQYSYIELSNLLSEEGEKELIDFG